MDRALRGAAAGHRQLGVGQLGEVVDVLAQDRRRARAVDHLAVAGHDVGGGVDERLEAAQRREVARRASRPREIIGTSTGEM